MSDKRSVDPARYSDMLRLPHPEPKTRHRMPAADRAAQFSPFAALTGYGDAIDETARVTGERRELAEDGREMLDMRLAVLRGSLSEHPEVTVTFFKSDKRKSGGTYEKHTGRIRRIDEHAALLAMEDGTRIPIADIYAIDSDAFAFLET